MNDTVSLPASTSVSPENQVRAASRRARERSEQACALESVVHAAREAAYHAGRTLQLQLQAAEEMVAELQDQQTSRPYAWGIFTRAGSRTLQLTRLACEVVRLRDALHASLTSGRAEVQSLRDEQERLRQESADLRGTADLLGRAANDLHAEGSTIQRAGKLGDAAEQRRCLAVMTSQKVSQGIPQDVTGRAAERLIH